MDLTLYKDVSRGMNMIPRYNPISILKRALLSAIFSSTWLEKGVMIKASGCLESTH